MSTHMMPAAGIDEDYGGPKPPHDLLAEQSVLGGMLLSTNAIGEVTEVIKTADFYSPPHAAIFEAILELVGEGQPVDPVTVGDELDRRGELARVGGGPYLHTLIATVPTTANAGYYAGIVAKKATLRRLAEAGTRISQYGYSGDQSDLEDVHELVDRAQIALDAVTGDHTATAGYATVSEMFDAQMAALDDVQAGRVEPGLPTPYIDLTAVTGGGWKPGQLIVIAARPGLGKSTVALDMARQCAFRLGKTAAIFSLEMSRTELWERIICAEARVRYQAMTTPHGLTREDYDRIAKARSDRIEASDAGTLIVDDTPNITMAAIRAKARRIQQRHGLDLLVVDYLQLMTSGKRVESRQLEISEFSRQLKMIAKELNVPVVALSQLNRGPEQRHDKRPLLADLRESGAIEQDADVVMLLNRPDAYEREDPRAGEADLILAKNRSGPTTTITVCTQLHYCQFADMAPEQ